ncbi:MAG TPA: MarR family transcriptional regulator [Thermoplasmata archaeon]|nr:MarR family transcriptional regulator [Thermoplasmata archaeon]
MPKTKRPAVALSSPSLEQEELWESFREVYTLVTERVVEELAPFGLAIVEHRALLHCAHGPVRATDLTRSLGLTPSGVTELVDRLERRGLVKRLENAADRRSVLIAVTPEGARLVESARAARRAYLRRIARSVPPDRQDQLKKGLAALRAALLEGPSR